MPLAWHRGEHEHTAALSQFVCTTPEKRLYDKHRGRYHPYPHELEVQSHLRGLRLPRTSDEIALLGIDTGGRGVGAAIHFGFDDTGAQMMIWALASAVWARRSGAARRALQITLGVMAMTREQQGLESGAVTHIDPRNETSRGLFLSEGFEYLDTEDGYEVWFHDLELG